jgi:hypothetical protein
MGSTSFSPPGVVSEDGLKITQVYLRRNQDGSVVKGTRLVEDATEGIEISSVSTQVSENIENGTINVSAAVEFLWFDMSDLLEVGKYTYDIDPALEVNIDTVSVYKNGLLVNSDITKGAMSFTFNSAYSSSDFGSGDLSIVYHKA